MTTTGAELPPEDDPPEEDPPEDEEPPEDDPLEDDPPEEDAGFGFGLGFGFGFGFGFAVAVVVGVAVLVVVGVEDVVAPALLFLLAAFWPPLLLPHPAIATATVMAVIRVRFTGTPY